MLDLKRFFEYFISSEDCYVCVFSILDSCEIECETTRNAIIQCDSRPKNFVWLSWRYGIFSFGSEFEKLDYNLNVETREISKKISFEDFSTLLETDILPNV